MISGGAVHISIQGTIKFLVYKCNLRVWIFKWTLICATISFAASVSPFNFGIACSWPVTSSFKFSTNSSHTRINLAWKNSRHLALPPLVSPRKEAWETSAEFPYWRCVTTKIWLVLLIGRAAWEFDSANQKHYSDLGSDASPVWCSFLRSHFRRETSSDVAKFRQFSLARINYAKQWDN